MITKKEIIKNSIEYKDNYIFCTVGEYGHSTYILTKGKVAYVLDDIDVHEAKLDIDTDNISPASSIVNWFDKYSSERILEEGELLLLEVK